MNKKFNRALSSVLAFIMVFSSMVVMNVSSASAAETTNMVESFDMAFSANAAKDSNIGNGVYAVDDLTYTGNAQTFEGRSRTGYISNATNPTDANGIANSNITYPVKGAALKFLAGADGTIYIDYYAGAGKSIYFKSVDSAGNVNIVGTAEGTGGCATFKADVENGKEYYFFGQGTKARYYGVKFVADLIVTVKGSVTGDTGVSLPTELIFTESGTTNQITADIINGSYSVELKNGKTYDVTCNDGTLMVISGSKLTVDENVATHDVKIAIASDETVTGKVYGPDDPTGVTITFTKAGISTPVTVNSDGTYTVKLQPGTYSVAVSAVSGYTPSSLSTADLTVKQSSDSGAENWKNILYTKPAVAVTSTDIYVSKDGTFRDKANYFTSFRDAMAAVNVSNQSEYIVHIAPGTYEEQVMVKANNVHFVCDSDDNLSTEETGAIISWYYGIGYLYYSAGPDGYYNEAYAVDKHNKGKVERWGSSVRVTGSGFLAEGITFQNTFNKKVTQAELDDGVEASYLTDSAKTVYTDTTISVDRTALGVDVVTRAATERAAAISLDGTKAELYNCKFYSSQDTVQTGTGISYFKDCTIGGMTDYIFGNTGCVAAFDNCDLEWAGYSGSDAAGYITATRGKYIFRDCNVTGSNTGTNVGKGYYGRPWAATADVTFINTNTNNLILDTGWTSMGSVTPDQVAFNENGNTIDGTTLFATTLGKSISDEDAAKLAAEYDSNFFGEWVPVHHVAYATAEEPADTTTVIWNFQNPNTDLGTIQGTTGQIAVNNDESGIVLDVDATSGKLSQRTSDAQFNAGTVIKVPVYAEGDTVTVVSYPNYHNYTIGGIAAENDTTTYTAKAADAANGYVEIAATTGAYLYSITLITNDKPVEVIPITLMWNFQNPNTDLGTIQSTTGQVAVNNDESGIVLDVDATSGKLSQRTSDAQFNAGTVIKVPVYAEGDTVTVVSYPNYHNYTIGGIAAENDTTTYTAKAADAANGYVEIAATATAYLYGITLVTTGTSVVTETSKFIFDRVVKDAADNTTVYVIGKIAAADIDSVDEVGFGIDTDEAEASKYEDLKSTVVYENLIVNEATISEAGYYFAGFKITDVDADFYASAFSKAVDKVTHADAVLAQ